MKLDSFFSLRKKGRRRFSGRRKGEKEKRGRLLLGGHGLELSQSKIESGTVESGV
jgi:hypothetical protein